MSLTTNAGDLANGLKDLRHLWENARDVWDDAVARDFEQHHWEPLRDHVVAAIQALERLAPVLARMARDCS